MDCPICMEILEKGNNFVTTECGHCFHTSCLMKNIAHNGFGCPYCRAKMTDEPEENDDEDEDDWETVDEDEDEEDDMFDEDALRGFRFFWNNINGDEHDENDIEDEEVEEHDDDSDEPNPNVPTTDFVAQRLREQGVTFDQVIHMICNLYHSEYTEYERADRFDGELFGKIRIIVSNYTPEQGAPTPVAQVSSTPQDQQPVIDFESQPKTNLRRNIAQNL